MHSNSYQTPLVINQNIYHTLDHEQPYKKDHQVVSGQKTKNILVS